MRIDNQFYSNQGGQAKFIDLWRCWTPIQLPLLKGNLPRVVFLSAPSTGKTALMEAKAFQCMQGGMNVLFLLPFADDDETKTLLTLKMQQQWQNLKEKHQWQNDFYVCSLKRENESFDFQHYKELVQSEAFKDAAIFADELEIRDNYELQALIDIVTLYEQRTIWLAITFIDITNFSIEKVKSDFEKHNFYIPELLNPIRNSKEIVKYAYPSIRGKLV